MSQYQCCQANFLRWSKLPGMDLLGTIPCYSFGIEQIPNACVRCLVVNFAIAEHVSVFVLFVCFTIGSAKPYSSGRRAAL